MMSTTNPYIIFSDKSVSLGFLGVGRLRHNSAPKLANPKVELCEVDIATTLLTSIQITKL